MITAIAWKNVWRNKSRSLTVISAVAVGVFAGVFSIAAMNSSVVQRIDAAVNQELSHIQINNKDFRSTGNIQDTILNYDSVVGLLNSVNGVESVTGRLIVRGIASTAVKSTGVEITGIDVKKEKQMFTLSDKLIPGTGTYFESDTKFNTAFIGEKLAKELNIIRYVLTPDDFIILAKEKVPVTVTRKLEPITGKRFISDKKFTKTIEGLLDPSEIKKYGLKIKEAAWSFREGSKFILTFLDINEMQTGAAFRVCGIYRTNNDLFEVSSVFVPASELRELTGLKEGVFHRIIIRLDNNEITNAMTLQLREAFPGLEVMSWKEIQPDLAMISDMMQQIYGITTVRLNIKRSILLS